MPKHLPAHLLRATLAAATVAAALVASLPAAASSADTPESSAPVAAGQPATATAVTNIALAQPLVTGQTTGASALAAALTRIGSPYRWGAAGPSAFDCSGLVMWSFRQVGVSLPHSSRAQSRLGTPVAKANLQPGDLVFFYHPVSHVAIYVGNGMVVHASTYGKPVKLAALASMPFNSARRI